MNRFDKLKYLYKIKGQASLLELVKDGKVTTTEYQLLTGKPCDDINTDQLINIIKTIIKEYKWIKSEEPFMYDGYLQCNRTRDRDMMRDSMDALQLGILQSIDWKLPNDTRKTITDYLYFLNMRKLSSGIIQLCFSVEEMIISEITTMSLDELRLYEATNRFDELFEEKVKELLNM